MVDASLIVMRVDATAVLCKILLQQTSHGHQQQSDGSSSLSSSTTNHNQSLPKQKTNNGAKLKQLNGKSYRQPFTVVSSSMPTNTTQQTYYVPNPQRRPLFTLHIANQDELLYYVVSFLELTEVLTVARVSKSLMQSLFVDKLYCRGSNQRQLGIQCNPESEGILLPPSFNITQVATTASKCTATSSWGCEYFCI